MGFLHHQMWFLPQFLPPAPAGAPSGLQWGSLLTYSSLGAWRGLGAARPSGVQLSLGLYYVLTNFPPWNRLFSEPKPD